MARYIVRNKLESLEDIKDFSEANYKFMPNLSSQTELGADLVFAR